MQSVTAHTEIYRDQWLSHVIHLCTFPKTCSFARNSSPVLPGYQPCLRYAGSREIQDFRSARGNVQDVLQVFNACIVYLTSIWWMDKKMRATRILKQRSRRKCENMDDHFSTVELLIMLYKFLPSLNFIANGFISCLASMSSQFLPLDLGKYDYICKQVSLHIPCNKWMAAK